MSCASEKVLAPTLDPRLYPDSRLQDCIRMLGNGCFMWSSIVRIRSFRASTVGIKYTSFKFDSAGKKTLLSYTLS